MRTREIISGNSKMQWWQEARFGMFIHWGIYALAARHEWVKNYEKMTDADYSRYFEHFEPDLFEPRQWAQTARKAGMKYFVITTKHHDGFCLWDTKYTDYKSVNTPAGKDLIAEVVTAFRAEGIKVGFYYSLLDWHHPHFTIDRNHPQLEMPELDAVNQQRDMKIYAEYMRNQVTELLSNYGKIDYMFFDYSYPEGKDGKGHKDWESEKLLQLVRELQPEIIINDRLDLMTNVGGWDFITPEQYKPAKWPEINGKRVFWETCQTFSGSWGYYRDETSWKSIRQLLILLIETVSKGGNLLLNVGPTARGNFDQRAVDRLNLMGKWLGLHKRAIYGCTQAPEDLSCPENCLLTFKAETNRLYIHILEWPLEKLILPNYRGKVAYAQLLHDASEIRFAQPRVWSVVPENFTPGDLVLSLPVIQPDVEIPVLELFLK
ncbi:MAG: alpha-L-fucosidase [Candidatus Cloacimonetes bacterium]|nr:alpha-L-fucosidase [Candidatus Cloacimonadota bacterium]